MKKVHKVLVLFLLFSGWQSNVLAQEIDIYEEKETIDLLRDHVNILAHDSLEGRLTGSEGERKAAEYIANYFKRYGLKPAGDSNTYYHKFNFVSGVELGNNNSFMIDGEKLAIDKNYNVVPYSASAKVKGPVIDVGFGIKDSAKKHNDLEGKGNLEGKVLLVNLALPGGVHPHSEFLAYKDWRSRLDVLLPLKPAAVIFHHSDHPPVKAGASGLTHINSYDIPLLYINDYYADKMAEKLAANKKIQASIVTEVHKIQTTGRNVVGLLDNNAAQTVVIGAHYDHLGYGTHGGSLVKGDSLIHNGADDNASGTAMVIELVSGLRYNSGKYNYLFMAFSGEELGLLGSNAFTKKPYFKKLNVAYMLNMDMVGRLDKDERKLGVYGTGTSPVWDSVIIVANKSNLNITTQESGLGSSDHTSFYLADIPALHFFTGLHEDYHKPTDDAYKVNFHGMMEVRDYIYRITQVMETLPAPGFTKTVDTAGRSAPRFTVTLGVMPDYFYKGDGLRLEGVTKGKPAEEAGIKDGDVIIRIGMYNVKDIMGYMQALSNFKKGEEVEVEVLRDGKKETYIVKF